MWNHRALIPWTQLDIDSHVWIIVKTIPLRNDLFEFIVPQVTINPYKIWGYLLLLSMQLILGLHSQKEKR